MSIHGAERVTVWGHTFHHMQLTVAVRNFDVNLTCVRCIDYCLTTMQKKLLTLTHSGLSNVIIYDDDN